MGYWGLGKGKLCGGWWRCGKNTGIVSERARVQIRVWPKFFFLFFGILSIRKVVHLPAVDHKQKIHHKLDYPIATCQFVPQIQGTSTSACDHNPRIVATIHALVGLTHCGYHW